MAKCKQCGASIEQAPKKKQRVFCSKGCCQIWWNNHPEAVRRRAIYEFECGYCGKAFQSYGNAHRAYCSHKCYVEAVRSRKSLAQDVEIRELNGEKAEVTAWGIEESDALPITGRIWIVCGITSFAGKIDHFVLRLPKELRERFVAAKDACVFCNGARNLLAIIQWQGDGFGLIYKRLENGQYPWPKKKGMVLEISRHDFSLLLEYPRFLACCEAGDFTYEPSVRHTGDSVLF